MYTKCDKEKVIEYRQNNKCATLQEIGNKCGGITKERVRQILNRYGEKTRSLKYGLGKLKLICPMCGETKSKTSLTCIKCVHKRSRIEVMCETCGKLFPIYISIVIRKINKYNQEHFFCSQKCKGRWLGAHYGWQKGVYQGNHQERKYNYDKIIECYKRKPAKEVAIEFNMPLMTVYYIAKKQKFNRAKYLKQSQEEGK